VSKQKKQPPAPKTAPKSAVITENPAPKASALSPTLFRWLPWIGLALIVGVYTYFRANLISIPFERDEGSYSYIGQLILDGKRPYIDFYEMKPPAIFYSYAALVGLFGASIQGIHTAFAVLITGSAILLFFTAKRLFNAPSALAAVLTFLAVSLCSFISGYAAQSEHIVIFYTIVSLYFAVRGRASDGRWWHWALSGVFMANAVMTKQIAVLFGGALLFLVLQSAFSNARSFKKALPKVLALTAGGLLTGIFWVALVAMQGGWKEMLFWILEFPNTYASVYTWADRRKVFWGTHAFFLSEYAMFGLLALLSLLAGFSPQRRPFLTFILLLLGATFLAVLPGYYLYGHYWLYFSISLSFAAALGVFALTEQLREWQPAAPTGIVVGILLALVFFWDFSKRAEYYTRPNYTKIVRQVYGDNPFVESSVVSEELKKRAHPGDSLLVMGSEPQMNFQTGMRSPTKHFFMAFLAREHAWQDTWVAEAKQDSERSKPRFLVHIVHPFSWTYLNPKKTEMFDFAYSFAKEHYNLIGVADLLPGGTKYLWDDAARSYPPVGPGQKRILVYERK
jgi:4-amino-4-deoxy-L-arabinose transferase-like glycosyltransferase